MILGWIAIIMSLIGAIVIGVGTYFGYRDRNETEFSDWVFILVLSGLVLFFLGWLFFVAYLFFNRGLDFSTEAFADLGGIVPDPENVRKYIVDSSDAEFRRFVEC